MAKTPKKSTSFEDQLARLETIVSELERQALPLDEALKFYEEGVGLVKQCQKTLTDAEQKVLILNQEKA